MSSIDEIKRLVSISSLLGSPDKRIKCPVPSHKDSHPSCDIDHQQGIWHCKVCDLGGDIFSLLQHRDGLSFKDALAKLADIAGVSLAKPSEDSHQKWQQQQRIYKARRYAVEYYHQNLLEHQGALNLLETRGVTLETIQKMKIGWASGDLAKHIQQYSLNGLSIEDFHAAGLLDKRGDAYQDYFDIRILFPLIVCGRVQNISGRKTDLSTRQEKYVHLRNVEIHHFYNEDALQEKVWLFEGHPDTLSGIEIGLPSLGVIGTAGMIHPDKLARCKEIYICPDNDEPGQKAAEKWAAEILNHNPAVQLYFVPLPAGIADFNEWHCKHRGKGLQAAFEILEKSTQTLIDYKISQLASTDDLIKIWPYLASMPEINREGWFKKVKVQLPNCGLPAIRKAFKEWKLEQDLKSAKSDARIVDISFEPQKIAHLNVGFNFNDSVTGHVCLYGTVKRLGDDGNEVFSHEPVLIRSILDTEKDNYSAECVPLAVLNSWNDPNRIPDRSIVEKRWSDSSIQAFLRGEADPVNTAELVHRICRLFKKYIWYENEANYEILAFYAIGTYVARIFGAYPYLIVNGLKNSGKTNAMMLMEQLCFNAIDSVSCSVSSTFRVIHSSFVTWIRDEAEYFNKKTPEKEEEFTILNSGYKYGPKARRVGKGPDGNMVQEEFDLFSPKIFGGINIVNDTLMSRGIIIKSHRAPKETVKTMPRMVQMRKEWERDCAVIRDELYVWTLTKFHTVKEVFENYPPIDEIVNREWEIWLPLLTIAYLADEENGNKNPETSFTRKISSVAIKKGKEKRQSNEEESIELKTLETILLLLEDFEITNPLGHPDWYAINNVAQKVTEAFKQEGYRKENFEMSSWRLTRILEQTRVLKDRLEQIKLIKSGGKTAKYMTFKKEDIESAIFNL